MEVGGGWGSEGHACCSLEAGVAGLTEPELSHLAADSHWGTEETAQLGHKSVKSMPVFWCAQSAELCGSAGWTGGWGGCVLPCLGN